MSTVESLPFDQYQRYRLVADLVEQVRGDRGPLRVLDVGGRTALLRRFLTEDDVHLVDMESSESPGLVLGDGSRLPFRDRSFDVVAAFDTLEHVPPPRRDAFVAECARVSRGHVLIAGPYQTPRVDEAEEILTDFLREKLGTRHRYLAEHRDYGLPDRATAERVLTEGGLRAASVGHGNLDRWLVLMCLELYLDHDPLLRPIAERIFRFYNESLYASDHLEPVYRHVVVGARGALPLPDGAAVLATPGAPPEAMPALLPLARELLTFDHQRDLIAPELERLHGVVRSLEEDVRQHDAALAAVDADLAAHRQTVAALQGELQKERAVRTALEQELARERADSEASRAALAADLEGHKKSLGSLGAELAERAATQDALQAEVEVRGRVLDEFRAQAGALDEERRRLAELVAAHRRDLEQSGHALADREARVEDLHSELNAALERARTVEQELDEARAEQARMVVLLRSRVGNLKRAFARTKFGS